MLARTAALMSTTAMALLPSCPEICSVTRDWPVAMRSGLLAFAHSTTNCGSPVVVSLHQVAVAVAVALLLESQAVVATPPAALTAALPDLPLQPARLVQQQQQESGPSPLGRPLSVVSRMVRVSTKRCRSWVQERAR